MTKTGLPPDWLARLRRALPAVPNHDPALWRVSNRVLATMPAAQAVMPATPLAAAVLVPIIDRPGSPSLLLTRRAGHLRHYAGQISFPGGRVETGDASVLAAALRETREEIGVEARFIEPLGYLPDHVVISGFRISPVVALLSSEFALQIDYSEVAEVFEIPLGFLCDAANFQPTVRVLHGVEFALNDLTYDGRVVWGATSGMLQALRAVLMQEP